MDVTCILGPSIVKREINSLISAQSLNFSGLCSSSVTAALALMTVSTKLLLMDKINFTLNLLMIMKYSPLSDDVVAYAYTAPQQQQQQQQQYFIYPHNIQE